MRIQALKPLKQSKKGDYLLRVLAQGGKLPIYKCKIQFIWNGNYGLVRR